MSIYKHLLVVILMITTTLSLKAQSTEELPSADSSVVVKKHAQKKRAKKPKKERDYSYLNPKKATIYSAILPGLGQAYNKRYWKIPIIYGLEALTIFYIIENNTQYNRYREGLNYVQNEQNNATYFEIDGKQLAESQLRTQKDFHKRNRDLNFIYAIAIYGLQIVDAAVDAHLLRFHDSKNFLGEIEPTFIQHQNKNIAGLSLTFKLKP